MKTLSERARHDLDIQNKRGREHYAYARSLGFTAVEARIISKQSKDNILKAAIKAGKSEATDVGNEG